jgi:FAD:protein FMN transferase
MIRAKAMSPSQPITPVVRRPTEPARRSRREFLTGTPGRLDATPDYWIRVYRRAMACRFEVVLDGNDARWVPTARAALDAIDRLEDVLSVFRESSAISEINRRAAAEPVEVDPELFGLLDLAGCLYRDTGGAFDITSTPLSRCWGFLQRDGRLPSQDAIDAARAVVGFGAVALDPGRHTIRFERQGLSLNLGAIGKGYALDHVATGMRRSDVTHALLSAGRSSLLAVGGRGAGWQVDIVSPGVADRPLVSVWLRDAALGTSGAGEQFVEVDGTRYGHVIDPRTGWPAAGVLSATAIASSAAAADALSTAFFVGGLELADRYCAEHDDVMALVTPDDGSRMPVIFGRHPGALLQ